MKCKLYQLFLISLLIRWVVFVVSPVKYTIYSVSGVVYMILVDLIFFLGLYTTNSDKIVLIGNGHSHYNDNKVNINVERKMVWIYIIISTVFFFLWIIDWGRNIGFNYMFSSSDVRRLVSEKRTIVSKLSSFFIPMGMVAFLKTNIDNRFDGEICQKVSSITMWFSGISSLASGARWAVIACITIFFLTNISRNKDKTRNRQTLLHILIVVIIILIIRYIIMLFQTRGVSQNEVGYLFYHGDLEYKAFWKKQLEKNREFVQTLRSISLYIAQPIPVFSYVFPKYSHAPLYYGANMFRIVSLILNNIGINVLSFKEIYDVSFTGRYTSYIYGYMVDWGVYFTPLFVFLTGLIFANIEKKRLRLGMDKCLYILTEVMCLYGPYYYFFQIGGMDYMIFWIMIFNIIIYTSTSTRIENAY